MAPPAESRELGDRPQAARAQSIINSAPVKCGFWEFSGGFRAPGPLGVTRLPRPGDVRGSPDRPRRSGVLIGTVTIFLTDRNLAISLSAVALRRIGARKGRTGGTRRSPQRIDSASVATTAGEGIRTLDVQLGKRRYGHFNGLFRLRLRRSFSVGDQLGAHLHGARRRG